MLVFEMFKATAHQLAQRQLSEAQRLALKHAALYEEHTAAAEASASQVRLYQDRAARISAAMLQSEPEVQSGARPAQRHDFPSLYEAMVAK